MTLRYLGAMGVVTGGAGRSLDRVLGDHDFVGVSVGPVGVEVLQLRVVPDEAECPGFAPGHNVGERQGDAVDIQGPVPLVVADRPCSRGRLPPPP